MKITWDDLTVVFNREETDLLADWRWLIDPTAQPILITRLGDAFLQNDEGKIFWLDVGAARCTQVAETFPTFQEQLKDLKKVSEWFIPKLVGALLMKDNQLSNKQCFGFKKPPFLGGAYEVENFEPTNLGVHFSILGQLAEQIKDLKPGTKISEVKFN